MLLSYIDDEYRMRQVGYDATADSRNSAFEQWLPEGESRLSGPGQPRQPDRPGSGSDAAGDLVAETWFCYPLPTSGRPEQPDLRRRRRTSRHDRRRQAPGMVQRPRPR